jgi:hypothetical protein
MTTARGIPALALLAAVAALGWVSCSGKQSSGNTRDAAAGTGGSGAGADGSGGTVSTGGSGATAGSGATGGGGGAGGDWGAAPDWEPTNLVAAGCPIERLANAPQVRFWKWKPCSWSPADCEEAVFNPDLVGTSPNYRGLASVVQDDGTDVRVGLAFDMVGYDALFGSADGTGEVGIRTALPATKCAIGAVSIFGNRFGVQVFRELKQYSAEFGGVLGDLDGPAKSQVAFTASQVNPGAIVQGGWLGSARWIWWLATYGYSTVSAVDGSGYIEFVTMKSPGNFVYLGPPITTGKLFLFDAFVGDDAGLAHGRIFYSDGIAAPQVYLEPTEPDTYYGRPIYANTYVGFFKGIGFQDVNSYKSVELWASPYSDDPSQLKPVKLGTIPDNSMAAEPAGGWGHAAFETSAGVNKWDVLIWNLADGTHRRFKLADGYNLIAFLGVSRKYAWVGAAKLGGQQPYLLRINVQ